MDTYLFKKSKNPSFSIRSWCSSMGIKSAGAFNQMLHGKRSVSSKVIPNIIESLCLSEEEISYLNVLFLDQNESSSWAQERLKKISPLNWRKKEYIDEENDILKTYLSFPFKTFLKRKKIEIGQENLESIFSKDIDSHDIALLVDYLSEIKKIESSKKSLRTRPDISSLNTKRVHESFLRLATKRLFTCDISKREYNSFSLNIKEKDMKLFKKRVRYYTDALIEEFADDKNGDITYQMGNYLYPIVEE